MRPTSGHGGRADGDGDDETAGEDRHGHGLTDELTQAEPVVLHAVGELVHHEHRDEDECQPDEGPDERVQDIPQEVDELKGLLASSSAVAF